MVNSLYVKYTLFLYFPPSFVPLFCVRTRASDWLLCLCLRFNSKIVCNRIVWGFFLFHFLCFRKLMRTRFPTHCTSRSWNYSKNNEIPPPILPLACLSDFNSVPSIYENKCTGNVKKVAEITRKRRAKKKLHQKMHFNSETNTKTNKRQYDTTATEPMPRTETKKKREILLNSRHSQPNINNSVLFYCIFRSSSLVAGSCRASCAQAHRKEIERNLSWIFRYST